MKQDSAGIVFSIPYEIAMVRPLRQTTLGERDQALKAAFYNTELLPQDLIYIDLSTDSGVSSMSTDQLAALVGAKAVEPGMGLAAEGSQAYRSLAAKFEQLFGFPYLVPTTLGRAAERIWSKLHVKPNSVVAGNMLFPSTRMHIEMNGGKIIDVIGAAAHELDSTELFKGNVDLPKLAAVFAAQQGQVCCVYVELAVNSCGGHPVSLGNLREVKALAAAHQAPLSDQTAGAGLSKVVDSSDRARNLRSRRRPDHERAQGYARPGGRSHRDARPGELSKGLYAGIPRRRPTAGRHHGDDGQGNG